MISRTLKYRLNTINYWLYGKKPTLLLHSGPHGDEYEVIDCVKKTIKKYLNQLPPFLFVPEVSPSAVSTKTRQNKYNHDINRYFFQETTDQEVITNLEIIRNFRFDLYLGFHEHIDHTDFYLYDSSNPKHLVKLKQFMDEIKKLGVELFNGIDDPEDPILKFKMVDGYVYIDPAFERKTNGTFTSWAFNNNIIKQAIDLEIPGSISQEKKCQIVDLFFNKILI